MSSLIWLLSSYYLLSVAFGQQNDFRARSLEDSWGHQAMRINRWSVMHRVWDGLYDLKNIKAENTLEAVTNYGEEREISQINKDLIDAYDRLIDTEVEVADSQTQSFVVQDQMNAALLKAVNTQYNLSKADRDQQLMNLQTQLEINRTNGDVFLDGIERNREKILQDARYSQGLYYHDQVGDLAAINSDILTKRGYNLMEYDYVDSAVKDSEARVEFQEKYQESTSIAMQNTVDLQQSIRDHATTRSENRRVAEDALRQANKKRIESYRLLRVDGDVRCEDLRVRAAAAKQGVKDRIGSAFIDAMNDVMTDYEDSQLRYLSTFDYLMSEQKERMQEQNRQRILLLQQDRQQMQQNEETIRRIIRWKDGRDVDSTNPEVEEGSEAKNADVSYYNRPYISPAVLEQIVLAENGSVASSSLGIVFVLSAALLVGA